ncbi:MAG: hypothetical protein ACI8Q1_000244 [Parvicella sp.]|jgi:hypothetical protein
MRKETTENNKLITEFMGFKEVQEGTFKVELSIKSGFLRNIELKFHTSWDWIMPVVERIREKTPHENALYESNGYAFCIDDNVIKIAESMWEINKNFDIIVKINITDNLLESIYKAVVEFIKWHNKTDELLDDGN